MAGQSVIMKIMHGREISMYLTKSRFKQAAECQTKLYYAARPDIYADQGRDDAFLEALKAGGFQVGALAKLMFPGGVEVAAVGHDAQIEETNNLLSQPNVTIFEAAFRHGNLFVRVDVLVKRGQEVKLIEVKATSCDQDDRPRMISGWLPYLQDIAFQCHVVGLARPEWTVRGSLLLPDKSRNCSVKGLAHRFRLQRGARGLQVEVADGVAANLGDSILTEIDVQDLIERIHREPLVHPGGVGKFSEVVQQWSHAVEQDMRLATTPGAHCRKCQFRNLERTPGLQDGFLECWASAPGATPERLAAGTILDIANLQTKKVFDTKRFWLDELMPEDLSKKLGDNELARGDRQRMQLLGEWPGGGEFFINREWVRGTMREWKFPLFFLDFEAARAAIPFHQGMRPYAILPFQFSVHRMEADGRISHAAEFLSDAQGQDPTLSFVRALRTALGDEGTVLMWSHYERTVLDEVRERLRADPTPSADAAMLCGFIASLCDPGAGRELVDMCKLAERAFFHPATAGSSSIKRVLPAVMQSSAFLQQRYSAPIYGAANGIASRNFQAQEWYVVQDGQVVDPYRLLQTAARDLPTGLADEMAREDDVIANGGAAAMAWMSLQVGDVSPSERDAIKKELLNYCELDTLAMVMIYEAWREWCA